MYCSVAGNMKALWGMFSVTETRRITITSRNNVCVTPQHDAQMTLCIMFLVYNP